MPEKSAAGGSETGCEGSLKAGPQGRAPEVTVIIPTINEEEGIARVLDSIPGFPGPDIEVLVVDTNSTDRTREIAMEKGARVIQEPRRGYGRAYKTGFEHAQGDVIVTLDADGTYPAEEIPRLVGTLRRENLDFITCDRLSRLEKGAMSAKHRLGNWILTTFMNLLFRTGLRDSQSGMWVFRRSVLEKLELTSDGMAFSEEIKIEAVKKGLRVREVPIAYRPRLGEVKLRSWADGRRNLAFLFSKRFSGRRKTNAVKGGL
ncbi:MAG: glycosyltransferase family 2 protein [Thermoplasmata archaeon]